MANVSEQIDMDKLKYSTINSIFDQKEKYIIIALTGKVGAGSSTIAKLVKKTLEEMNLSYNQPGLEGFRNDEEREQRILQRYYSWHQKKFHLIKVRDVILSFLLEDEKNWNDFISKSNKYDSQYGEKLRDALKEFQKNLSENNFIDGNEEIVWFNSRVFSHQKTGSGNLSYDDTSSNDSRKDKKNERNIPVYYKYSYINTYLPAFGKKIHNILRNHYTEIFQYYGNQLRFFGTPINEYNANLGSLKNKEKYAADHSLIFENKGDNRKINSSYEDSANSMYTIAKRINQFIKILEYPQKENEKWPIAIVIDSIKNIYESNYLKDRYTAYYLISASRDEEQRKRRLHEKRSSVSQEKLDFIDLNEQPKYARKKLRLFARLFLAKREELLGTASEWRNYLQEIADSNEQKLLERLLNTKNYDDEDKLKQFIESIKDQNGLQGEDPFREEGISNTLYRYYCEILKEPLRIFLYVSGLYPYYLQDVESCIQNADIFLTNNEISDEKPRLCQTLVRYLSLMMHPGLVPPTPVERCMQLAYTAKANSGCISRQVGAVVTDSDYKILSLGWNDVPCGQTSCVYRNLIDVSRGLDAAAYSEYEIGKESEFKKYTQNYRFERSEVERRLRGLPVGYCFKDMNEELTGEKNPMMARSMHAEEKALILCNKERAKGGYLFTTSSPCLMCSKNAKEHGIKKIYYIEPYPGISQTHVCNSGDMDNRAQYVLFEGAIGRAYTQLYTPIMPYKDELQVRGVPEAFKKSNILPDSSIDDKAPVSLQEAEKDTKIHSNIPAKRLSQSMDKKGKKRNDKIRRKRR